MWKIPEESQLIFRSGGAAYEEDLQTKEKQKVLNGSGGTVDSVSMLDDELFVSGSDSGYFSLNQVRYLFGLSIKRNRFLQDCVVMEIKD